MSQIFFFQQGEESYIISTPLIENQSPLHRKISFFSKKNVTHSNKITRLQGKKNIRIILPITGSSVVTNVPLVLNQ